MSSEKNGCAKWKIEEERKVLGRRMEKREVGGRHSDHEPGYQVGVLVSKPTAV